MPRWATHLAFGPTAKAGQARDRVPSLLPCPRGQVLTTVADRGRPRAPCGEKGDDRVRLILLCHSHLLCLLPCSLLASRGLPALLSPLPPPSSALGVQPRLLFPFSISSGRSYALSSLPPNEPPWPSWRMVRVSQPSSSSPV